MALYVNVIDYVTGDLLWESGDIHVGSTVPHIPRCGSVEVQADGHELRAILKWNEKTKRLLLSRPIDRVHTFVSVSARKIVYSLKEILSVPDNEKWLHANKEAIGLVEKGLEQAKRIFEQSQEKKNDYRRYEGS